MKKNLMLIFAFALGLSSCTQKKSDELTFLRTSGHDMVNEAGEKVFLKGVGLGNWFLPEGYMWKFDSGNRFTKITLPKPIFSE